MVSSEWAADLAARPAPVASIPEDRIVIADVREELRAGREPFSMIMEAHARVPEGGALCVRAIFEPVPLYRVMASRHGLSHHTEMRAPDDWIVWFYAESAPQQSDAAPAEAADTAVGDDVVVLDVRGLEPPEPMVRTLEALERLPEGATLLQINVRVPQFLLPKLEERGWTWEIREQDEDLVRLFIRRRDAAAS